MTIETIGYFVLILLVAGAVADAWNAAMRLVRNEREQRRFWGER